MGKHKRHKSAALPIQEEDHDHHQRRPSGILSVLNYHHWHWRVVKKRLNKNHDGHKHDDAEAENPGDDVQAAPSVEDSSKDRKAEMANSKGEGKKKRSNPIPRHSVKSKLKALITEEMSKRKAKGRHRRSSTCPAAAELTRDDPTHHTDDSLPAKALNKERLKMAELNNDISSDSSSENRNLLRYSDKPFSSDENDEEYEPFLIGNDSSHDQVDEVERKLIENATHPQDGKRQAFLKYKSISSKDLKKHASEHQLKYYKDAVDMINMDQGFLLTILQDPGSPLAHHFHKQRSMTARMGMAKLGTFPSPASSSIQNQKQDQDQTGFLAKGKEPEACFHGEKLPDHDSTEDICRKSTPMIAADYRADGIHQLNQTVMPDVSSSPGSAHYLNQADGNQLAKRRFKHLKEKIKYAIKESKKERHRIAMDAVLHKIPHEKGFSKDLSKDIVDYFPSRIKDVFAEPSIKKKTYHKRSASSFNESMDRYRQLYEANFSREAKEDISNRVEERREEEEEEDMVLPRRTAPKTLGRILSSPELHSYFFHSEDSCDELFSDMPTTLEDGTLSICSLNETKALDVSAPLDYHSELDTVAKSESEDNSICIREKSLVSSDLLASTISTNSVTIAQEGKTSDEPDNLMIGDNVSPSEQHSKPRIAPITELEESNPIPLLNLNFEVKAASPASQEADLETKRSHSLASGLDLLADVQHEFVDSPKIDLSSDLLQEGIDTHNKDKFTYVRHILELSGFCGNEALGKWYANDQPMDPLVCKEVKGCISCDPNSSIVQEVAYCNHPLLFDLINEVLMELYEKSYSYYPRPLSSCCHIHPMPVGYHVLEKVWKNISWYLSFETGYDKPLDYVASRDLKRSDGWMNLQFENECLGLELEDLIFYDLFNDLLDEFV